MALRKSKHPKRDTRISKKKNKYRIRNWPEYNQSLVNRGSVTFWFSPEVLQGWYSKKKTHKRGRPEVYSDGAIRCALVVKAVFRIALRALQGFVRSLIATLRLDLITPHYSQFSRRARDLEIPLRRTLQPGERLNVIFDSTGIKVFGEGEWKVRKHGYSKRRTWRKVHVGMCADTGEIIVGALTSNDVNDDEAMIHMMGALEGMPLGDVLGDGAYDTADCREAIHDLGGRQIIPPKKNARLQGKNPLEALRARDQAILRIRELGPEGAAQWKIEVGYHRRSLVETCMFRYKTIVGDHFSARLPSTRLTEMKITFDVLNRMQDLGRPKSYKVAS